MARTPMRSFADRLPIDAVLNELSAALAARPNAVLVAPPGAGKTTRVPLVLMDEPWTAGQRIIVLEPRRLAARAAAQRMADQLDEKVGDTVGLRVRMESRISAKTRIEVVTEGVFGRMILDDPALEGVAAVLFDEFHERSLDADLGLALALDAQAALREDLRLLVMSATLDGARVRGLLPDAALIESEGRAFPVETVYLGRDSQKRIEDEVTSAVLRALAEQSGSVLVFVPGQGEITRITERLTERLRDPTVDIAPLFGAMDRAAQDRAVSPAPKGRRKVVLATSIAETSLTIEGVRVVIDSGLSRVPRYEPDIGVTRLETVRASRASADQRRGRAGRTGPGVCYRLWEEAATGALPPFAQPEILSADLSGLLLDCTVWGARDPATLLWLDPPPKPALAEARAMLAAIGALDEEGAVTERGRQIGSLPLPPRLAAMVLEAARSQEAMLASDLALVLSERGLGTDAIDLADRVERMRREASPRARQGRLLAEGWARAARGSIRRDPDLAKAGRWLAVAYPDRIAKARGKPGEFVMANGRGAAMEGHERLAGAPFLVIADFAGSAARGRILAAAAITPEEIAVVAGVRIESVCELRFDSAAAALRARRRKRLGAIVLSDETMPVPHGDEAAAALAEGLGALGAARWPWTKALAQWRDRVMFLRRAEGEASAWPDLSDGWLTARAGEWMTPFLSGKTALSDLSPVDLEAAMKALVPWDAARRLDAEAPTHFEAPTGSRIALDYETEGGPVLRIRVQELYGLSQHPSLAKGRVPLTLELLSPAHRPIQVTRDLPGFWRGSWKDVKSEMKGRYPRHLWPDDPASAPATARAKPRGA